MTQLTIRDSAGQETARTVRLPDALFDAQVNIPLIHQVVVGQLAAARQGTHATKGRGDVRGGGAKPHRQKGTGRARQGSRRAPHFSGGGVVHGPTPRGYEQRTPKRMKAASLAGALSDRARTGRVYVVAELVDGDEPSTRTALAALTATTEVRPALVVVDAGDDVTYRSLRNVADVHVVSADQLNSYDVLIADDVVFTEAALTAFCSGPVAERLRATGFEVTGETAGAADAGGTETDEESDEQ